MSARLRNTSAVALAILAVAAAAALIVLTRQDEPEAVDRMAPKPPASSGAAGTIQSPQPPPSEPIDVGPAPPAATQRCLTPWQVDNHPLLYADAGRMEAVAISGQTMEAYRNLTAEDLEALANQGDSAAMAVLGAIHLLRARGMSNVDPVSFLVFDDWAPTSYPNPDTQDPEVFLQLGLAREWFYRAAQHGRLLALYRVGEVDGLLLGGPVGLGWLGEEEYEALETADRGALLPENVYNLLAWEIAPTLRDGVPGIIYDIIPKREIQVPILQRLAEQFERDRMAAKLPPIDVAESTLPPIEDLFDLICDEYKDERNRELWP